MYGFGRDMMQHASNHPAQQQLSPNAYPQSSAVNMLGALAHQHQSQQYQMAQQYQHQQYQEQQYQNQQFLMSQHIQQQYEQQMLMQHMQERAMINRNMEHHQLGLQQRHAGNNSASRIPSPDTRGIISPKTSTPRPSSAASSSRQHRNITSPVSVITDAKPVTSTTCSQPSTVQPKKARTNFHSIADLVGDTIKPSEPEVVKPKSPEPPVKKVESLTDFIRRGKRQREELDRSTDSESGQLLIDESRTSPAHSMKLSKRELENQNSRDSRIQNWIATSPEPDWRPVSPALSTVSSIRDTDTPCSAISTDSFSSCKDEEKERKGCEDGSKRPSKSRRIFQAPQIHVLEHVFSTCQYPEPAFIEKLARDLDTTDGKIRVWFQNKRARFRKRSNENDPSKQSPWLPGTPLYQSRGQLPVAMTAAQQQVVMQQAAQGALLQQRMMMPGYPQIQQQMNFMGMH